MLHCFRSSQGAGQAAAGTGQTKSKFIADYANTMQQTRPGKKAASDQAGSSKQGICNCSDNMYFANS